MRRHRPKQCDTCGRPYYRRNKLEGWTGQNPGHRGGWVKTELFVCTFCQPAGVTERVIALASLRVVKGSKAPRRKETKHG